MITLIQPATGKEVHVADDQREFWLDLGYAQKEEQAPASRRTTAKK